ncbi:MAG: hypothetical protein OXC40_01885 [Proteobacteria bacterium]|nr:hypothetical protein [Pseudomonadota bacterium]
MLIISYTLTVIFFLAIICYIMTSWPLLDWQPQGDEPAQTASQPETSPEVHKHAETNLNDTGSTSTDNS